MLLNIVQFVFILTVMVLELRANGTSVFVICCLLLVKTFFFLFF